jgi:hypothetical protein
MKLIGNFTLLSDSSFIAFRLKNTISFVESYRHWGESVGSHVSRDISWQISPSGYAPL